MAEYLVTDLVRLDKAGRLVIPGYLSWCGQYAYFNWDANIPAVIISYRGEKQRRSKLDDKHRIVIPKLYREVLGRTGLMLSLREDDCLVLAHI